MGKNFPGQLEIHSLGKIIQFFPGSSTLKAGTVTARFVQREPGMPDTSTPLSDRDRFVAFAFAAAELLVETGPAGSIIWAGGAFASRMGAPAETFFGKPVCALIAPADHLALERILAQAALLGRVAPTRVRLADAAGSECGLGALAMPGAAGRICLTVANLPAPSTDQPGGALADGAALGREAESALRAGQPAKLGLLDVGGWSRADIPATERRAIGQDIAAALAEQGGPGARVADMGAGRFGVLGRGDLDVSRLAVAIEAVLRLTPGLARAGVQGQALALMPGEEAGRETRALRYALASFAKGGHEAVAEAGFGEGLAGFLAGADARAAALGARIAARRFRLAYQPVVALAGREIHHFEALIRPLPDPAVPGLSVQDFVTYAEAVGLSEQLDLAVATEVVATLGATRGTRVAANISGLSMQNADFRDRLLAMVPADGRLLIELTETADIADTASAAATIAALREAGAEVGIDDFGAGSAAFRYLRDFRVDHVKIDGSYVRTAGNSAHERGLVAAMRDMAHNVGASAIAEQIETETVAALMAELGVTYGQGYLFGRPGHLPGLGRT